MKTFVFLVSSLCAYFTNPAGTMPAAETNMLEVASQLVNAGDREDDEYVNLFAHIKRPNGLPYQGASVTLTAFGQSTPAFSGTSDSNGDVTFDGVPAGSYRYKVTASGYQDIEKELTLTTNTSRTDTLVSN